MPVAQTIAFTPALLVAEFQNDPQAMGYAALLNAAQGPQIAQLTALINLKSGKGSGTVAADPISGAQLLALINPPDLNNLTIANSQNLQLYTTAGVAGVQIGSAALQTYLATGTSPAALFTAGGSSLTNAALVAAATRAGSRAEVLWGTGVSLSDAQVLAAVNTIKGT